MAEGGTDWYTCNMPRRRDDMVLSVCSVFAVLALMVSCAQAYTLTSVDAMGTNATVGAGGTLYQGCELCTAGNRIVAVPVAGAGIMLFDALATGAVTDELEGGDIVTSLATEIPDINQLVCGTTIAMAVGVSGTDLKVHFVYFNATADTLSSVDIVFDNTINGAAANHVVASAKSTNSFVACGTEATAGVWRCAVFDVAADGTSVTRNNFEGTYDNTGYVLPGISFDGLKMVLVDLTEGGVQGFSRSDTSTNFTKIGHTSTAGQTALVTAIAGNGAIVKRLQYHRRSLSFIGVYKPHGATTIKMFAIRLSALPGHTTVVDIQLGAGVWVDAVTTTEIPTDFYINRYGSDLIGIYHDGTNPLLTSNLMLDLGHAGPDFDATAASIETETSLRRVIEMCPILGTDGFVWATVVSDNDVTAYTYTGTYFASPTINSITSGTVVTDNLHADSEILINNTIVINWTITEPGTNARTRIDFIPMDLDENHADSYDVSKWVEIASASAATYSVTLDLDDISAVNPEALTVSASSALNNITSGSWLVRVSILKLTGSERRVSTEKLIIVVDNSDHSITDSSASVGIGSFDMSDQVVDATKIRAVCQSSDVARLYVVEVGQGVHEYAIDMTVTHRKDVFTFTQTHSIALAFTDASCVYEDDVILFASATAIHAYTYSATTGLLVVHHTAALNLTTSSVTMDGGFTAHRESNVAVRILFYTYPAPTTHPTRAVLVGQTFNQTSGTFAGTPNVDTFNGFTPGSPAIYVDTESDSYIIREIQVNDTASKTLLSFTYASQVFAREAHADFVPGFKDQTRWFHSDHSGTFANDAASISGGLAGISAYAGADRCGHNGVFTSGCDDSENHLSTFNVGRVGRIKLYEDKIVIYEIKSTTTAGFPVDHYQHVRTIYFVATANPAVTATAGTMDCACVCGPPLLAFHDFNSKHPISCVGDTCKIPLYNGIMTVTAHSKDFTSAQFIATHIACEDSLYYYDIGTGDMCTSIFKATCGNNFTMALHVDDTMNVGLGIGTAKDTSYKTHVNLKALSKTSIMASSTGSCHVFDSLSPGSFGHGTGNLMLVGADSNLYFGGCFADFKDPHNQRNFFSKYFGLILVASIVGVMLISTVMLLKNGRGSGYTKGF